MVLFGISNSFELPHAIWPERKDICRDCGFFSAGAEIPRPDDLLGRLLWQDFNILKSNGFQNRFHRIR